MKAEMEHAINSERVSADAARLQANKNKQKINKIEIPVLILMLTF